MARSMAASAEHERCDLDTIHCDPGTFPAAMTNWTSAWRGIDFSSAAAATNSEQSKKEKQPVRISEVVKDGQLPQVDISTNERSNQLPLVLGHSLERNPRTPTRCRYYRGLLGSLLPLQLEDKRANAWIPNEI